MELNYCSLIILLSVGGWVVSGSGGSSHPCEHSSLTQTLHDLVFNHSSISSLHPIGNSSQGRPLWVMVLGERVDLRPRLRPQVKLVGNLNGYSGPACMTLLTFVKRLLSGYQQPGGGGSPERRLLQSLEIHVLFDMNPDAFAKASPGSCTAGFVRGDSIPNLNRDFPSVFPSMEEWEEPPFDHTQPKTFPLSKQEHRSETEAVMRWSLENNFLLSLSLLAGHALVVYPFDDELELGLTGQPHLTPDDDVFKSLASSYTTLLWGRIRDSSTPWNCPTLGRNFPQGWVNGAEWYPARGTMMDWSYVRSGTPELTLGLGCCRNPLADSPTMRQILEKHGEAIFSLLVNVARGGVRGQVVDSFTGEVLEGTMLSRVGPLSLPWFTSPQGEFWRLLPRGTHSLEVSRESYRTSRVTVVVGGEDESDTPNIITIRLRPLQLPTTPVSTTVTLPMVQSSPFPSRSPTTMFTPTATTVGTEDSTVIYPTFTKSKSHSGTGVTELPNNKTTPGSQWIHGFNRGLGVMLAYSSSAVPILTHSSFVCILNSLILLAFFIPAHFAFLNGT